MIDELYVDGYGGGDRYKVGRDGVKEIKAHNDDEVYRVYYTVEYDDRTVKILGTFQYREIEYIEENKDTK